MAKVKITVNKDSEEPGDGPTGIVVEVDGKTLVEGAIGGEPEDNCIIRDYAWVVPALKAVAEKLGADVEIVQTVGD